MQLSVKIGILGLMKERPSKSSSVKKGRDPKRRTSARVSALQKHIALNPVFFALFEQHQAVLLLIEPQTGAIVDANPAAVRFYGYSRAQLCSMLISDINQLPKSRVTEEASAAALGVKNRFIFPHRLASGAIKTVEVLSSPIDIGGVTMLFSIVNDVTDRQIAEEALAQRNKDLALLLDLSQTLAGTLDLHAVLQTVTDRSAQVAGFDTGAVYLISDEQLYLGATTPPLPPGFPEPLRHARLADHPLIRESITKDQPTFLRDARAVELTPEERVVVDFRHLVSIFFVPLLVEHRPIGILILGTTSATRSLNRSEIDLYRTLAGHAALAIENARLYEDVQRHVANLELRDAERTRAEFLQATVYRISVAAQSAMHLGDLYRSIHEIICTLMPARNFFISLYDPPTDLLHFPYFSDEFDSEWASMNPGRTLTGFVLRTGRPLLATPETCSALERAGEIELYGAPSVDWLGVPLKTQLDQPLGVMVVQTYHQHEHLTERDKDVLMFVSSQVASAIERKRAEEALRVSEERHRRLVESFPNGIAIYQNGVFVYINPAAMRIIGASEQNALLGKPVLSVVHPDSQPAVVERMKLVARGELVPPMEERLIRLDGTSFDAEVTAVGTTFNGKPAGQVIVQDITERKRAEQEHHRLEQQLLQAQRLEGIGTLASGIAHDFNNILNAIMGNASLLQLKPDDRDRVLARAGAILQATERGAQVVKQLLAFARKSEIQLRAMNINTLIREVCKLLVETFPRTIAFQLDLDPSVSMLTADANQLHQVLLNLSVNARDAMPNGGLISYTTSMVPGASIALRHPEATANAYVQIRVKDSGQGMSEEVLSRVFDPFFTTKGIGQGSGLGLAVVQGIIQRHNGFIDVTSAPGAGTEFLMHLPLSDDVHIVQSPRDQEFHEITGGSETILFVDDEPQLRESALEFLSAKGYRVLLAADGDEALSVYDRYRHEIALVLSDYGLPKYSGEELHDRIAAQNPHVQFVLLTGYLEPQKREDLLHKGINSIMMKPYKPTEILKQIRLVLS